MKVPPVAPVVPVLPASTAVSGAAAPAARTAAGTRPAPTIEGTVLAHPSKGLLLVRTAGGNLTIPSAAPIAIGDTVRVPLDAVSPRPQPASGAATPAPRGAPAPGTPTAPAPNTSTPSVIVTTGSAAASIAAPSSSGAPARPAAAPGIAATLMAPMRWSPAAALSTADTPVRTNAPATPSAVTLPAGSRLIVDIVSAAAAQTGEGRLGASMAGPLVPSAPGASPGQTLSIIEARAIDAQTSLVRTPLGPLQLPLSLERITRAGSWLRILHLPSPPSVPTASAASAASAALDAHGWPALERAIANLGGTSVSAPAAATLPRADQGLAGAVVRFLAALAAGDVRAWLGEPAAQRLERRDPVLLTTLSDDFGRLARTAGETVETASWRTALIPFIAESHVRPMRIAVRRRDDDDDSTDGTSGAADQRFLIDVTLPFLGRLQIDGLASRTEPRLDLMVRTEVPLPPAVSDAIAERLEDAGRCHGFRSHLRFDSGTRAFIEPERPPPAHRPGIIV